MNQYIASHEECSNLDSDTFWAIANIMGNSNMKGLEKYKEKEEINMCNAFEENWLDGLEEGMFRAFGTLVKDGIIKSEEAAKRMNITEAAFNEKMKEANCSCGQQAE